MVKLAKLAKFMSQTSTADAAALPRIIVTSGEPAGIGPDITLQVASTAHAVPMVAIGDLDMLKTRAEMLKLAVEVVEYQAQPHRRQVLPVIHRRCDAKVIAGELNPQNSGYVIDCIDHAVDLCLAGSFDAMVTAAVHKAIINQSGIAFSGHTEWIAARCAAPSPVMMLANGDLRVCLLTNHFALAEVPALITKPRLEQVIGVIMTDLKQRFGIAAPRLGVCGLNPHAGEDGYLGREEIDTIAPTLQGLRDGGANLIGPLPADTAFTVEQRANYDAILAMYHDQGLPVIKHAGFGETVNITLGLPIIRTSVDHGTAITLAGSGAAKASSLQSAIEMARQLSAIPPP